MNKETKADISRRKMKLELRMNLMLAQLRPKAMTRDFKETRDRYESRDERGHGQN